MRDRPHWCIMVSVRMDRISGRGLHSRDGIEEGQALPKGDGAMRSMMCVLLGVLVTFPTVLVARTIVVRPDGSGDYPTIQAAVDAAAPSGDVIQLASGTF